jgi:sulfite reductase (NADPH) flavoprotein alpha-component
MVPVLPESAPFTPAQRAWLNGFFAGILGMQNAECGLEEGFPNPQSAIRNPQSEEEFPWHDPTLPLEERLGLAEGRPLERVLMAAMAQLDCGTCGYLCQTYAEAIARGEESDLRKCVPGGKETARKLKELTARGGDGPGPALPVLQPGSSNGNAAAVARTNPADPDTSGGYDRNRPQPAAVLEVTRLCGESSEKDVRHVALDLSDTGLSYEVGDALGVYPENCPELVEAVLARLGAGGDEPVSTREGRTLPAWEALARTTALNPVNGPTLSLLARWAAAPSEARRLQALAEDNPDDFLEGQDLLDLLDLFPSARGPVGDLVASLSPLQPRLYSIASSLKAHPAQVHLTVGVVRYTRRGCSRQRRGVASTFLADRVRTGQMVNAFIQSSHGFRLPTDGDTPVIMVGPGTGIAPFRAFLQDRRAVGARGKNWLFFGDQHRSSNFLYRQELEEYQKEGLLTRLDLAFSRDQQEKVYVQHRMLENASDLWAWLEGGAYFYVCGDATRMARDVDEALHRIISEQGNFRPEAAKAYVAGLKRAKRYQRDVY